MAHITTKIYFLIVLETTVQNQGVYGTTFLLKSLRKDPFWPLQAAGCLLFSLCVFVCLLIGTLVVFAYEPILLQYDFILVISTMTLFPNKIPFRGPEELELKNISLEDINLLLTEGKRTVSIYLKTSLVENLICVTQRAELRIKTGSYR